MPALKPVRWIASAKDDLSACPDEVRRNVVQALYVAQRGDKHSDAKILKGFGGAGLLEIVARHDGGTFRPVYTVRFYSVIYVLHVFQKKSKRGIATPQQEVNLVRSRLKLAEDDYAQWTGTGGRA